MLDFYLKAIDLGYFEVSEAFKDLADEHVWLRPTVGLLSIGELAGHIAHMEAIRFAGNRDDGSCSPDFSDSQIKSPLLDPRFRYYSTTLDSTSTEEQLQLKAKQVWEELDRVHREAMAHLKVRNPDLKSPAPYWSPQSNYGELLHYVAFHVSYHTGQMYSVRHLLGDTPPDN